MKFNIITLGCKVNNYESEFIKELLLNNQYQEVKKITDADICIVNTCSVTNNADTKSRHIINRIKNHNPNCLLIVLGCSAQNNQLAYQNMGINILLGNKDKSKILDYIKEYQKNKKNITKFYDMSNTTFESMEIINYTSKTRAYIKIQDGCNNFCSYCIIPYLRGNLKNKEYDLILKEAQCLSNNHQEIVLTGIHTGSYNFNNHNLVDLINDISKLDNIKRIRVSSIEITELTDSFISLLKNNPKVCDHLHIPLQSGSNSVLKLMNRKYDTEYFINTIKKIKRVRPNINITTDIIVGFPGETEKDFNDTLKLSSLIPFTKIHVFPYSIRTNTVASKLKNQINEQIKKERVEELIGLSNKLEYNYNLSYLNKTMDIIIEEVYDTFSIGHTDNYLKIIINEVLIPHQEYNITICKVDNTLIYGKTI